MPATVADGSGVTARRTNTPVASTADLATATTRRRAVEPGEEVEVGVGGDLDPSPSRQLTVTQLQHALRIAYAANTDVAPAIEHRHDGACATQAEGPIPSLPGDGTWLAVVPAQAGAGASVVALALADAVADDQGAAEQVHLIEWADPARSGLAAATDTELGHDTTGAWQVGRRANVTLYRRNVASQDGTPLVWPAPLRSSGDPSNHVVVLDLSGTSDTGVAACTLARQAAVTVLVTHSSVPGVRAVDRLIERWHELAARADAPETSDALDGRVIVVAVGPRRWPGAVTASLGPRLADLRRAGRVVPVPIDAGLWVSGANSAPLPPRVRTAARAVLTLLPRNVYDEAPVVSPTHGRSANRSSSRDRGGLDTLFDLTAEDRR